MQPKSVFLGGNFQGSTTPDCHKPWMCPVVEVTEHKKKLFMIWLETQVSRYIEHSNHKATNPHFFKSCKRV